jgi:hypothetical protein
MYSVKLNIIVILAALSPMSLSAQTYDSKAELAASSFTGMQPIVSVVYKTTAVNPSVERGAAGQPPDFENKENMLPSARSIRTNNLGMGVYRTDIFTLNDRASFKIYAQTQAVNGVLSFAKAVSKSRLDDALTPWIQGLSLLAKRQINTELTYTLKVNNSSKFDSSIIYRLNPNTDSGKSDVVASLRYHARF